MKVVITFLFLLIFCFNFQSSVLSASSFIKYGGNPIGIPILNPDSNSWEQNNVYAPFIIYDNGLFRMYYTGTSGSYGGIGYATSIDGINWTKFISNPILSPTLGDPTEARIQSPSILIDDNIYKMWYQAVSFEGINRIKYATSSNGIDWSKVGLVNLPKQAWEGGTQAAPSVLKNNNGEYQLWFMSNDGHWRISHAISNDGINWTQNSNNPVISPTMFWEGADVGDPSVLYSDGKYEMYYANGGVFYAYSNDGTNWEKPSDKNPVINPSGGWDNQEIEPYAIKLINGTTYLYYSGVGYDGKIRIGLATDGPLMPVATPTATPTSTPTPTPTVAPTSTPMPTPTPLPTPIVSNKVIVIPGFGGSWNQHALGFCLPTGYDTPWTSWGPADQVYNPIIQALSENNFVPYLFNYDWRRTPPDLADDLATFINNKVATNEKLNIVGHSMGGLVARAYIEKYKEDARVAKLLTAGTPHSGATNAYPAWAGGDAWGDLKSKAGIMVVRTLCGLSHTFFETNAQLVRKYIPSVQTFLPTFDYIYRNKTKNVMPVSTMIYQNPWLGKTSSFEYPFWGITVGTISGKDKATPYKLGTIDPLKIDILMGEWADGRAFEHMQLRKKDGDSLVLNQSSTLPGADNRFVTTDHGGTIRSPQAIQEILQFLSGNNALKVATIPSYDSNTKKESLILFATQGEISATSDEGKQKVSSKNGVLYIENPGNKVYKTKFTNPKAKLYMLRSTLSGDLENVFDIEKLKKQELLLNFKNKLTPLQ